MVHLLGFSGKVVGRSLVLTVVVSGILLATSFGAASPPTSTGDVRVTGHTYVRHDGGSDPAIATCNSNDAKTGGSHFRQNEPSVAVNPQDPTFIAVGANDYCTVPAFGDVWLGIYVSTNGGGSWKDSLLPGYPTDTSALGKASPIFGRAFSSGDPVLAWDDANRLFVGGISFNRVATNPSGLITPTNGDAFVSTWQVDPTMPLGLAYVRTVDVALGTPTPNLLGLFDDKPALKADSWLTSGFRGNVYLTWTLFRGTGLSDTILISRSTDHGASFSPPMTISSTFAVAQGSAIAIAPNGDVYVFWRQFRFLPPFLGDAIVFVKSTDGGVSFSAPRVAQPIIGYDRFDQSVSGGFARDCGSLDLACASGFTFHRSTTFPQAAVDDGGTVVVTWEQLIPAKDDGDTYHPDGQAQVMVSRSMDGGMMWTTPAFVDKQSVGHQWWPNIAFDRGSKRFFLIYYDSREDPSYSVNRPPGNTADGKSPCLAASGTATMTCDVLNTFVAASSDGGMTWSSVKVSTTGHQPEYETAANRRVPFHGDYIGIDATGGMAFGVWTDNRNVVPGEDLRETQPGGPGTPKASADGFDVHQCRLTFANGAWGADTCPNAGGLDQDIYGAPVS